MCCKLMAIAEIAKPRQSWCPHADPGNGCRIYPGRPSECRAFNCGYLVEARFGEHWRPTTSRMVIVTEGPEKLTVIHVDAGRPDAWRREPYYSEIKQWAMTALPVGGQVIIQQRTTAFVVLPDRDKEVGTIGDDQVVVTRQDVSARGLVYDAFVMDKSDPRLDAIRSKVEAP
jgi:hypothetical protein